MDIGFMWANLRERVHLEDLGVDGRITLELTLKTSVGRAWTELIWVRKGSSGGL